MRGEGEPNPVTVSLSQFKNLVMPGVYAWQGQCPVGTEFGLHLDFANDALLFLVNGTEADRVVPSDLADNWGDRAALAKNRMMAKAWERHIELAPVRAIPRAEELLRKHLTEAQNKSLSEHGWIEVDGGKTGHAYRIYKDTDRISGRNVELLINGQPIAAYGAKPGLSRVVGHELPWGDVVLGQKLTLECNESEFLSKACVAPIHAGMVGQGGILLIDQMIDDPYGQYNEQMPIRRARQQMMHNMAQANVLNAYLRNRPEHMLPGGLVPVPTPPFDWLAALFIVSVITMAAGVMALIAKLMGLS